MDAPILNLGCGTRTSPFCVNVDWNPYLRLRRSRVATKIAPLVIGRDRADRLRALSGPLVAANLKRGIPLPDESAFAVYHCHVLEHFDREDAFGFVQEIRRVLRPGGIHRVVVPDLERLCRAYVSDLDACLNDRARAPFHDEYVAAMLEQSVRRKSASVRGASPWRRMLEEALLGDARRRGETHQWMYDWVNLRQLLERAGFTDVERVDFRTSRIPCWDHVGLDTEESREYKPGSLYLECTKQR